MIGLVVSGLYYVAASLIFPAEFGERADFDAHYMRHRAQVSLPTLSDTNSHSIR